MALLRGGRRRRPPRLRHHAGRAQPEHRHRHRGGRPLTTGGADRPTAGGADPPTTGRADRPAWPTAGTHVAAVIGHPVGHSLSPVLHNAAFAALGLDWVYLAFDVPAGAAGAALEGMRALGIGGLSVTTPHKDDVARLVDRRSPTAERLGAVNTVVNLDGELVGESTDGQGFLDAVRADHGFDPAGRRCVIRGSGGAARAVVLALAGAGATDVVVVPGRDRAKAEVAAALAGAAGRVGTADEAAGADLVVNATTLGMAAGPPDLPLDPSLLGPGQLVVDIVYPTTPFVTAARLRGATAATGLGMLLHQAAGAFRLWTGQEPPIAAMSASALSVARFSEV